MFMDFMNHIKYAKAGGNIYGLDRNVCFPPLAYVFYGLLGRILPDDQIRIQQSASTGPYAIVLYVICVIVLSVMMLYLMIKTINRISGPLERGNSSFFVLALLLEALILKEAKEKWKKELALVSIAIAAGFKIYPAVFGILYLVEKRNKEAIRLVAYGALAFFLPFCFFGGIEGMKQFLINQMAVQSTEYSRFVLMSRLRLITQRFGLTGILQEVLCWAILGLCAFILLLTVFKTKKAYIRLTCLTAAIVFFPSWSGSYTLLYFAIPMVYYFQNEKTNSTTHLLLDICYGLLFSMAIVPLKNIYIDRDELNYAFARIGYGITLLSVVDAYLPERWRTIEKRILQKATETLA